MTRAKLDISINLKDGTAIGMVSGFVDFFAVPGIGDHISLDTFDATNPRPKVQEFNSQPRVTGRIFPVTGSEPTLLVEDMLFTNRADAECVAKYLESSGGLIFDPF